LIRHALAVLPAETTEALMLQQSRQRRNTPLALAVKAGNIDLVTILLETARKAIAPTLTLRDCTGAIPLHSAVLNGHATIVSLLAAAGPPEALYLENAVGATPLEIARHLALCDTLRGSKFRNIIIPGFQEINAAMRMEPLPGYRFEDAADIKAMRDVLDATKISSIPFKNPELLNALTAYADRAERDFTRWRVEQNVIAAEAASKTYGYGRGDVGAPRDTLKVISTAVEIVHQRILVHLRDVQQSVLDAIKMAHGSDANDDEEEEEEEAPPHPDYDLSSKSWVREKDTL